MKVALAIVCAVLAALDVWYTWDNLRQGAREKNPVVRFLYKKLGSPLAALAHAILWAAFIALPWFFMSAGMEIGYAMLAAVLVWSGLKNYQVGKRLHG